MNWFRSNIIALWRYSFCNVLMQLGLVVIFLHANAPSIVWQSEFESTLLDAGFPEQGFPFVYIELVSDEDPPFRVPRLEIHWFLLGLNCLFFSIVSSSLTTLFKKTP